MQNVCKLDDIGEQVEKSFSKSVFTVRSDIMSTALYYVLFQKKNKIFNMNFIHQFYLNLASFQVVYILE